MKTKIFLGLVSFLLLGVASTASHAYGTDTWWFDQVRAGNHGTYNNWPVPALPSANYPGKKVSFPNNYYPYSEAPNKCGTPDLHIPDHFGGSAYFGDVCNNHDMCYMTLGETATNCNINFARGLGNVCEDAYRMFRAVAGATATPARSVRAVRVTLSNGTVLNLLKPIQAPPAGKTLYRFCPGCSLDNIARGAQSVIDGTVGAVVGIGDAIQTSVDIVVDGVTQTVDATVNLAAHTIEIAGVVYDYVIAVIEDPTLRLAACLAVTSTMTAGVSAGAPTSFPKSQNEERDYLDWVYGENKFYLNKVMVPIFSLILE